MKARNMESRKSQKGIRSAQEGVRALGTGGHPDLAKPFINVRPDHFRMRNHLTRDLPEPTVACLNRAKKVTSPLLRLCFSAFVLAFPAVDRSSLATSTSSGTPDQHLAVLPPTLQISLIAWVGPCTNRAVVARSRKNSLRVPTASDWKGPH